MVGVDVKFGVGVEDGDCGDCDIHPKRKSDNRIKAKPSDLTFSPSHTAESTLKKFFDFIFLVIVNTSTTETFKSVSL